MSIILDGVSKRFGGQVVVEGVSLEIADGELFVLLGSSGSGKSTVLRIIAGLTTPDAGTVTLHGEDVTGLPPQQRGIGFVFQNYSVFRHMTVAENVEFGLMIRKVAPRERARRRDELLDLVGLVGLGARRPHQLSGGQQQRVALARALAYHPRVLLLDEPFGALDARIRKQVRRSFAAIQATLGITTILVTHDQEEAFDLGNRIGVIERGHLLEVGDPETLYARPRSSFVATFVGAGNVLAGRAAGGQAHFGPLALPIPPQVPHEDGQRVHVLFRPEDIELGGGESATDLPCVGRGVVVENAFAGPVRRVRLRLPHLPGTRQVAPPVPFGERDLVVDALIPAERGLADGEWTVRLKRWRILERPAPRLLVLAHPVALALAATLGGRIDGVSTVLGLVDHVQETEEATQGLKRLLGGSPLRDAQWRVRQGPMAEQIHLEQAESLYDVVVLPSVHETRGVQAPWPENLLSIVARSGVPVLVGGTEACSFRHLLVATAAGEPGKATVRFAGWLARRLQAQVTVLHVVGEEGPSPAAEVHLSAACDDLAALDVKARQRRVRADRPEQGILAECGQDAYDLVVLGRHEPEAPAFLGTGHDVTRHVLLACRKPVLVVTGDEG